MIDNLVSTIKEENKMNNDFIFNINPCIHFRIIRLSKNFFDLKVENSMVIRHCLSDLLACKISAFFLNGY